MLKQIVPLEELVEVDYNQLLNELNEEYLANTPKNKKE